MNPKNFDNMKRVLVVAIIMALPLVLSAQNRNDDWKAKMRSEKIAFITSEVGITPEEAQAFWPVYNDTRARMMDARDEMFRTYKALCDGVEAGKDAAETERLLKAYIAAREKMAVLESSFFEDYSKVLPVEKVAKVYLAEEKFRRHQFHNLNCKPSPGGRK